MKSLSFAISASLLLVMPMAASAAQPGARVAITDISATFIHSDESQSPALGSGNWFIWNSILEGYPDGQLWLYRERATYSIMERVDAVGLPPRAISEGYVVNDPTAFMLGFISAYGLGNSYEILGVTAAASNQFIIEPGATLNIRGRAIFDNWIVGPIGDSSREVSAGMAIYDRQAGGSRNYNSVSHNDFGHYEQWLEYSYVNTGTTAQSFWVDMYASVGLNGGDNVTPVPEAGAGHLLAAGLAAFALLRQLRRRNKAGNGSGTSALLPA